MDPLVSILIPAYNSQEWIAETLRCVTAQTWQRKEVIVVDDGSSDQTLSVARQFESGIVRVVTQSNQGAASARNKALCLAQGDYIQWLDADDLLAPDKIARQMECLHEGSKRTLFSSAWARFIYRPHRAHFVANALWEDMTPVEFLYRKVALNLFMANAAWLVSRELTEAAGPWDSAQLVDDDGEYFCRVILASDGIRFVPKARMYYRMVASSSHSHIGTSAAKLEAQWRSIQTHIQRLLSLEQSDRVRTACVHFLQLNLNHFHPERPDIVAQAQEIAGELGGSIQMPRLPFKYRWIAALFGRQRAKGVQRHVRGFRKKVDRSWDRFLLFAETGSLRRNPLVGNRPEPTRVEIGPEQPACSTSDSLCTKQK